MIFATIILNVQKTNRLANFLYNLLVNYTHLRKVPVISKVWNTLWRWQITYYKGLVLSKIHGENVILTNGHCYSLVCRMYPKFNQPLFSVVRSILNSSTKNIIVVDVGTAVGDTVLFLETNFPKRIDHFVCIDGDAEFFSFQEYNLSTIANKSTKVFSLLSDKQELTNTIDKKEPTTGSAIGLEKAMSKTLDQVLQETGFQNPDLIKIDIDGYDGKAIGGAIQTLKNAKPVVIFEWNTPLFNLVNSDILQPFEVLQAAGYDRFIWFSNKGDFLNIEYGFNANTLKEMELFSTAMYKKNGHHFDIIALHKESPLSATDIAIINETQNQTSPY